MRTHANHAGAAHRSGRAYLAHHIPNVSTRRVECPTHLRIDELRVGAGWLVTRVVLEQIDPPAGVRCATPGGETQIKQVIYTIELLDPGVAT